MSIFDYITGRSDAAVRHHPAARAEAPVAEATYPAFPAASVGDAAPASAGGANIMAGGRVLARAYQDPGIERLPAEAAEHLRHLRQVGTDARGALEMALAQVQEVRDDLDDITVRRSYLKRGDHTGRALDDDNPALIEPDRRIKHLRSELARLTAVQEERAAPWQAAVALVGHNLERWIAGLAPGASITMHPAALTAIKCPANPRSAVEKTRSDRANLIERRENIMVAPLPSVEAKRRARAYVAALAQRGEPDVLRIIDHRLAEPELPMTAAKMMAIGPTAGVSISVVDTAALLAWADPDALIRKLEDAIDRRADDKNAMSDADRARAIREHDLAILENERGEEAIIRAAEREGHSVIRRWDADPRAVLGLSGNLPGRESI